MNKQFKGETNGAIQRMSPKIKAKSKDKETMMM